MNLDKFDNEPYYSRDGSTLWDSLRLTERSVLDSIQVGDNVAFNESFESVQKKLELIKREHLIDIKITVKIPSKDAYDPQRMIGSVTAATRYMRNPKDADYAQK